MDGLTTQHNKCQFMEQVNNKSIKQRNISYKNFQINLSKILKMYGK